MAAARPFRLRVNGADHEIQVSPDATLLHVLRNDIGANAPKYGCGLGQCGACTVIIDGKAARACVLPAETLTGREILTLDGIGSRNAPDPVQAAFIAEDATQCGYCLNGMILTLWALLKRNPEPTDAEIRDELRYNLCRCGSHIEVLRAAHRAVAMLREDAPT